MWLWGVLGVLSGCSCRAVPFGTWDPSCCFCWHLTALLWEHPLVTLLGQGGDWVLLQLLLQDVTKSRDSSASVPFGHCPQFGNYKNWGHFCCLVLLQAPLLRDLTLLRGCRDPTWFGRKSLALLTQEPRPVPGSLDTVRVVTQHRLEPGLENRPWPLWKRSERNSQGLWGISGSEAHGRGCLTHFPCVCLCARTAVVCLKPDILLLLKPVSV